MHVLEEHQHWSPVAQCFQLTYQCRNRFRTLALGRHIQWRVAFRGQRQQCCNQRYRLFILRQLRVNRRFELIEPDIRAVVSRKTGGPLDEINDGMQRRSGVIR